MKLLLEYIWIDGDGNLRNKTRVHNQINNIQLKDIPDWNYDGSSTKQATGEDSEVIIKPVALYTDPFRGDPHKLVLCDTWLSDNCPHSTNTRIKAKKIFDQNLDLIPLFGIEQEFFLSKYDIPIGLQTGRKRVIKPQGDYYCSVGADNAIGRECIEKAFLRCLKANLHLTGLNAEVAPSQWEFQVCSEGISCSDELYIMRYIIGRTAEEYGWNIDIRPKPISGDWNGSGCHTNFSTLPMREDKNGYEIIEKAIENLGKKHNLHIKWYGEGNKDRLTGLHETSSWNDFSWGIANRKTSVRVPKSTVNDGKGYFEDRRPSSNMDPYIVTSLIFSTTCDIDQNEFI